MGEEFAERTVVDLSGIRPSGDRSETQRPVLLIQNGADLRARHALPRGRTVVGRDPGCDIPISDTKASRRHAEFDYEPSEGAPPRVVVRDLGSTNGIFVNGRKVPEAPLHDRDKIVVGSTILRFFLREESVLRAEERLLRMASMDALTGLHNRASFDEELAGAIGRRGNGRPLSLLVFDIDHFKKFNDTYGHQTGDDVLRGLGDLVREGSRIGDFPARYGGEEFVAILHDTALREARSVAERLRERIEAHDFVSGELRLKVTVSVGVAELDDETPDGAALVQAADKALYRAKAEGRNRVCWRTSPESTETS